MRMGAGAVRSPFGISTADRCSCACHVEGDGVLVQFGCGSACEFVGFLVSLYSRKARNLLQCIFLALSVRLFRVAQMSAVSIPVGRSSPAAVPAGMPLRQCRADFAICCLQKSTGVRPLSSVLN